MENDLIRFNTLHDKADVKLAVLPGALLIKNIRLTKCLPKFNDIGSVCSIQLKKEAKV